MRWRRRPSPAQLEQWLATGEPAAVERWLDDPEVSTALDQLSALSADTLLALKETLSPVDGFEERTAESVRVRVDDLERVGVLFGLLGLAPRVAASIIDPRRD